MNKGFAVIILIVIAAIGYFVFFKGGAMAQPTTTQNAASAPAIIPAPNPPSPSNPPPLIGNQPSSVVTSVQTPMSPPVSVPTGETYTTALQNYIPASCVPSDPIVSKDSSGNVVGYVTCVTSSAIVTTPPPANPADVNWNPQNLQGSQAFILHAEYPTAVIGWSNGSYTVNGVNV